MQWIDVSIPLREGMKVWPGHPPFSHTPMRRIAQGDRCNMSMLSLSTHIGTHVDAPWHFEDDGKRLDEMDPSIFFGDALLIDLPEVDAIKAEHLGETPLPPRVLFKTRNSDRPLDAPFDEDFVAIDPDAAYRLVQDGVRLVGVDAPSIAPFRQESQETHHALLGNDTLIIEALRLGGLSAGVYPFIVLPLALSDADGAPCRAFIGNNATGTA